MRSFIWKHFLNSFGTPVKVFLHAQIMNQTAFIVSYSKLSSDRDKITIYSKKQVFTSAWMKNNVISWKWYA